MTTKPRLSGDTAALCGMFTQSKNNCDATSIYRAPQNSTIASILSVRAFELGCLCGLGLRKKPKSPCVVFCRDDGFVGSSREDAEIFTLEETHASRKVKPHANCIAISSLVELSKKTSNILKHQKDCHEEDGAYSWAKYKIIITRQMPTSKTSRRTNGWNDWRNPRTKKVMKHAQTFVDRWIQSRLLNGSWVHPYGSGTAMVENWKSR